MSHNLLIIDADPTWPIILSDRLLADADIEVVCCQTLDEGLERVNEDWIAILLDLGLPGKQGLSPLREVLAQTPTCPIIVLSSDHTGLGHEAMIAGADWLLRKDEIGRHGLTDALLCIDHHREREIADNATARGMRELAVAQGAGLQGIVALQAIIEERLPPPRPGIIESLRDMSSPEAKAATADRLLTALSGLIIAVLAGLSAWVMVWFQGGQS